jgi:hypothetical protein
MPIDLIKAGELGGLVHVKALLHGNSGAGKTWASVSAPSPIVLLTEANGMASIKHANPDAIVVHAKDMGVVREFFQEAMSGTFSDAGCKTIVVDSLTEIQRMMRDEIMVGRQNYADFSMKDWGELTERMRRFVRILRDVPYHVVATALSSISEDADGVRHIVPQFQGRAIGNEIAGYFSLVGYVHKREVEDEDGGKVILRRTMLEGPSRVLCKPCGSLGGIVESDITEWFREISGDEAV